MEEELKYPQVTKAQLDLWLELPFTKVYLQCLAWEVDNAVDKAGTLNDLDPASADRSHARAFQYKGLQEGFTASGNVEEILNRSGMLEEEDDQTGTD